MQDPPRSKVPDSISTLAESGVRFYFYSIDGSVVRLHFYSIDGSVVRLHFYSIVGGGCETWSFRIKKNSDNGVIDIILSKKDSLL